MSRIVALDRRWLSSNPLPDPADTESKEERGRVLVVAGSARVPGAALLAGVAALHAGAGKLQVTTAQPIAPSLALQLPEAMVSPLPATARGEISGTSAELRKAAGRCDALLLGPGMIPAKATTRMVRELAALCSGALVIDAGAIGADPLDVGSGIRPILTPHAGELAACLDVSRDTVEDDPLAIARRFAEHMGAIVVMKGVPTHIVDPDGIVLRFQVHAPGLGTSGSGDVLAGVITGLLARGAAPLAATAWGVWLHGQAGQALARRVGPIGYLAREISREIPPLMHGGRGAAAARSRPRRSAG